MNIALLHYSAPPIVGGVESVMTHQARLMADAGHTVRIIAARGKQTDPRIAFVALPLADSRHVRVEQMKQVLDAGRVPEEFAQLTSELVEQMSQALAGVDVLIAHNVCSLNKNLALTAALHELNERKVVRMILWHHDLAWTSERYRPELHNGYPWDLLRTAWPGATQVVISDMRRDELAVLMHIAPNAIKVVPNGIDLARFYKIDAQTQPLLDATHVLDADLILLLPVRITPRKNIELALRTLAELRQTFANAMLIITGPKGPHNAGNDRYFAQLKTLRDALRLQGAAHFLAELSEAMLPDSVVADWYRIADALLLPSREEGFGLPMLEAALSRMAIFAADIPALRALANGHAQLFSPDADPQVVAQMITTRLSSDAQYNMASRVRSQFSWQHVYQRHIEPLFIA